MVERKSFFLSIKYLQKLPKPALYERGGFVQVVAAFVLARLFLCEVID